MQFIDLAAQQARLKDKIDARIQAVLSHGKYILGPEVTELEEQLSAFCGAKHTITCANGTDALMLALMALEVRTGDAVFVPAFTFAATAEVVPCLGAVPIMVDCIADTFNMDPESLKRSIAHARELGLDPKVVIPVDLFGLPADYSAIEPIARQENLQIIADSAQGFGARIGNQVTGTFGQITTTSFFPAKPLGCYGDGGAIFTDDSDLAALMVSYRFHGKGDYKYDNVRIGMNSRLDTLQAAILLEKLAVYQDEIQARQRIAARYSYALKDRWDVPTVPGRMLSVWAQYTLKAKDQPERDEAMARLKQAGIPSVVYYPLPLHKQTAYNTFPTDPQGLTVSEDLSTRVFSLPMHPYLSESDQDHVIEVLLG